MGQQRTAEKRRVDQRSGLEVLSFLSFFFFLSVIVIITIILRLSGPPRMSVP